jgi:CDP-paratose 2-epimerase
MSNKMLISGGGGFIGYHCARFFSKKGLQVVVLDNLSRKGSAYNMELLKRDFPITHCAADVRDAEQVSEVFRKEGPFSTIIHLAAQVAVTTSVVNPREDFMTNALGTMNMLEGFRTCSPEALFIYASTNKVYGNLSDFTMVELDKRFIIGDFRGVNEGRGLDFHSPYGCSKGCADQYVIDYARIYGLRSMSFRQSCIYGDQQFGVEDQGWVAWFIIAASLGIPLTIYGNGKQIRDILYIDDLLTLYELAIKNGSAMRGEGFNIGGGIENTMSPLELIDVLREEGLDVQYRHEDWRPGDQRVFYSDNDKAAVMLGWKPRIVPREGIRKVIFWVRENRGLLRKMLASK